MTDINPTDAQSTDLTAPHVGHSLPFKEGDLVVHISHGTSRYGGIRLLDADGITKEYLQLEYAGGDRIYVPIEHLERVQKHTGEELDLTRLGKQLLTKWSANPPSAKR